MRKCDDIGLGKKLVRAKRIRPCQSMQRAPYQVVYTEPSDVGFGCVSRKRGFTIFLRRDCGKFLVKPQDVYDRLMLPDSQLEMKSIVIGTEADVQAEQPEETATRLAANDYLTLFELHNEGKYQKILDRTLDQRSRTIYRHMSSIKTRSIAPRFPKMVRSPLSRTRTKLSGFEVRIASFWPRKSSPGWDSQSRKTLQKLWVVQ